MLAASNRNSAGAGLFIGERHVLNITNNSIMDDAANQGIVIYNLSIVIWLSIYLFVYHASYVYMCDCPLFGYLAPIPSCEDVWLISFGSKTNSVGRTPVMDVPMSCALVLDLLSQSSGCQCHLLHRRSFEKQSITKSIQVIKAIHKSYVCSLSIQVIRSIIMTLSLSLRTMPPFPWMPPTYHRCSQLLPRVAPSAVLHGHS